MLLNISLWWILMNVPIILCLSLALRSVRPSSQTPANQMVQLSSQYQKTLWWILAMRRNFHVAFRVSLSKAYFLSRFSALCLCGAFGCHHFSLYCFDAFCVFAQVFTGLITVMYGWKAKQAILPDPNEFLFLSSPALQHPRNYFSIISKKNNRLAEAAEGVFSFIEGCREGGSLWSGTILDWIFRGVKFERESGGFFWKFWETQDFQWNYWNELSMEAFPNNPLPSHSHRLSADDHFGS